MDIAIIGTETLLLFSRQECVEVYSLIVEGEKGKSNRFCEVLTTLLDDFHFRHFRNKFCPECSASSVTGEKNLLLEQPQNSDLHYIFAVTKYINMAYTFEQVLIGT